MDKLYYERTDYSVVVKNRAPPPKAWRWEIYRAGNANPIKLSSIYFETTAAARRAGKDEQAVLSWTKRVRKAVHKLIHAGRYSAAHVEKADEKFGVVSEAVRPVSS